MTRLYIFYALLNLFSVVDVALGLNDGVITITTYTTTTICLASVTAWKSSSSLPTHDSSSIHSSMTNHSLSSTRLTTSTLLSINTTTTIPQSRLWSTPSLFYSTFYVIITETETESLPLATKRPNIAQNHTATRLWASDNSHTRFNGTGIWKGTAFSAFEQSSVATETARASIGTPPIGSANQEQPRLVWIITLLAFLTLSR